LRELGVIVGNRCGGRALGVRSHCGQQQVRRQEAEYGQTEEAVVHVRLFSVIFGDSTTSQNNAPQMRLVGRKAENRR
jgi:hypothetical protein